MRRLLLPVVMLISFAILSNAALGGAGLSPASVDFEDMVRGGYAERYITVSNPTDEMTTVTVGTEGDISGWATAEPQMFNLSGISYRIVKIIVRPPSSIPNGVYSGRMLVVAKPYVPPEMSSGSSVSVASVIMASVSVEISDLQMLSYKVENVRMPDTEECRPILVYFSLRNTGNVNVTPRFDAEIISKSNGETVQKYSEKGSSILPTQALSHSLRIPYKMEQFKCVPEGLYRAHIVSYTDSGSIMDTSDLDIRIYPRGTLTVGGEIMSLEVPNNVTQGDVIKINALFKNTGEIPVMAKLKAEVYSGGRLVDTVSSEQIEVGPGSVVSLPAYYTPSGGGKYKILASVIFEEKSTETVQAEVEVLWPQSYMIIIAILIVACLVAIYLLKFKGKK